MKTFSILGFFFFLFIFGSPQSFSKNSKNIYSQAPLPLVKTDHPLPSNIFIQLAKKINPTVVNIYTETTPKLNYSESLPDSLQLFFHHFFGEGMGGGFSPFDGKSRPPLVRPAQSLGTGFVIKSSGLILTNAHVVRGADVIKVKLHGQSEEYKAKIIGSDEQTDVALIQIKTQKPLIAAKLGTSKTLQVGEWVAAFGNPYGHSNTMTKGIVSALGRDSGPLNLFPFIQTDASINPGNSGGPLVNIKGEVIGMNTAIDARAQGIGFAIPIDNVKRILKELENTGQVKRGFLGVAMMDLTEDIAKNLNSPTTQGVLIINVVKNSAALKAGIQSYDIITKFGDKKIETINDLRKAVAASPIGEAKTIELYRNGKKKVLSAHMGSKTPPSKIAKSSPSNKKKSTTKSKNLKILEQLGLRLSHKKEGPHWRFGSSGVLIEQVTPYSPAFRAGLRAGDIILEINQVSVSSKKEVNKNLKKNKNLLRIRRGERVILLLLS